MGDRSAETFPWHKMMIDKVLEEASMEFRLKPLDNNATMTTMGSEMLHQNKLEEASMEFRLKPLDNNATMTTMGSEMLHQNKLLLADSRWMAPGLRMRMDDITPPYVQAPMMKKSMAERRREYLENHKQLKPQETLVNNNLGSQSNDVVPQKESGSSAGNASSLAEARKIISNAQNQDLCLIKGFEPDRSTCTCNRPSTMITCRMCGIQVELKCYMHFNIVGGDIHHMVLLHKRPGGFSAQMMEPENSSSQY